MIRYYSLFVASDEMLQSPYVQRYRSVHDVTLHLSEVETVNFLLQTPITRAEADQLEVIFDPIVLSITKVELTHYEHQTVIAVTMIPKELGSHRIGFSHPVREQRGLPQYATTRVDPFRRSPLGVPDYVNLHHA